MKLILLALLLPSFYAFAAVFHLAENGDDSNTVVQAQNPATPWKTLGRLNSAALAPGDSVLFRRGDAFSGTITVTVSGNPGAPIVYGAYGSGSLPVIRGSVPVTGWTENRSGLQSAACTLSARMLFCDNLPMTLARFPNNGYRMVTDTITDVVFEDSSLDGSTDWTGARAHVRSMRWTIASKDVIAFDAGQKRFTLSSVPTYGTKKGWGYFLNDHRAALDTAGEWVWDSLASTLYARMPDDGPVSGHALEAAVLRYGFDIRNVSNIVIESLMVRDYTETGVAASGGSGIVLRGLDIRFCDAYGINLGGMVSGRRIDGCTVYGSNTGGINIYGMGAVVENNRVLSTALLARLNAAGLGDQCCSGRGLEVEGDDNIIRGNILDSTGYIAIGFSGQNTLIEYNYIDHTCVTKDDGAGIYTWSNDYTLPGAMGTVVRYNIVINSVGAVDGTPDPDYVPANGIYMDDRIHDVQVYGNTTAFCGFWGYQLHNNYNLVFTGNTAFGNRHAQLSMNEDFTTATDSMRNNRVSGNILCSATPAALCLYATSTHPTADMGTFDSNYYWNPYSEDPLSYLGQRYGLPQWQAVSGQDAASKSAAVRWTDYKIIDTLSGEMVNNNGFDLGIASWGIWPSTSSLSWDTLSFPGVRCLKVTCPHDGVQQPIAISSSFGLKKDSKYLLTWRARAEKPGFVGPVVRQSGSPWASRGLSRMVAVYPEWKEYAALFTATETDSPCRVDFNNGRPDSAYWLDDVSLFEVEAGPEDTGHARLLLNPTMRDSLVSLPQGVYCDLDGNPVAGVLLKPFASAVVTATQNAAREEGRGGLLRRFCHARPNPFNPEISFEVERGLGPVSIEVYRPDGRLVARLEALHWNASAWPSGLYLARVRAGAKVAVLPITLLK